MIAWPESTLSVCGTIVFSAQRKRWQSMASMLITWDAYSIRYITGGYATVPCRFPQAQMVVLPINGDPHGFLTTSFSCYELRKEMPLDEG